MAMTDLQKEALDRLLGSYAREQRRGRMHFLLEEMRSISNAHGYDLLRQMDLVWQRADDYSKQHGGSDTPGLDLMSRLAAHLLSGWVAEEIDMVKLEPTPEVGEGWKISCSGRRRGGSERKVFPEEVLDALEALVVARGRGEELLPMPLVSKLGDEPWRVVVFAREASGKLHRLSLGLDHRLTAGDAMATAFERAIRTGVLTGSLDEYELRDSAGAFVDVGAPLWRSGSSYPIVYEMRRKGIRGPIDVEVHFEGQVFSAGFYAEESLGKVVREALESLGQDPKTTVAVHTLSGALIPEDPLDQREVVGVLAGGRKRLVFVLERGTVDELRVTVRLGTREREVVSHVTESDTVNAIICAVLVKVRPPVMESDKWELVATLDGQPMPLGNQTLWMALRGHLLGAQAEASSNVIEGAGRGFVARALRPIPLLMRLRETKPGG